MYNEICAELGAAIAVASSAPYIQFSLIFVSPSLEVGRFAFFQHGKDYYSVSISRGKVTGVSDLKHRQPKTDPLGGAHRLKLSSRMRMRLAVHAQHPAS